LHVHGRAIGRRGLAVRLLLVVAILWGIGLLTILLWLRGVGTIRLRGWRTIPLFRWVCIRHVGVLGRIARLRGIARLWGVSLVVTTTQSGVARRWGCHTRVRCCCQQMVEAGGIPVFGRASAPARGRTRLSRYNETIWWLFEGVCWRMLQV
jgi:hypothetical protein